MRAHSPAAERNRDAILAELRRLLPERGLALEVASGSGQHAAHFAAGLPGWRWQPTDVDQPALASIDAWCSGLANVLPARRLDVLDPPSAADGLATVDALFCANMLHIAPWACCAGLMRLVARCLADSGCLVLYGPYLVDGVPTAPGNLAFDADLRARNPAWGLRRLADVLSEAAAHGLVLQQQVEMPANNRLLVLRRARAGRSV